MRKLCGRERIPFPSVRVRGEYGTQDQIANI